MVQMLKDNPHLSATALAEGAAAAIGKESWLDRDDEDRAAVAILAQKGYSTLEIAQITGVKAGTVKKWMVGNFNREAAKLRQIDKAVDNIGPPSNGIKAGKHWWTPLTGRER
jgi:DNA-directed RNA polymerase specialized sigma24 family protein